MRQTQGRAAMAKNVHKVPKKLWNRMNKDEQGWFNRLWHCLTPMHLPTGVTMTQRQLNVLRHNVCLEMAWMMRDWRE